MTKKIRISTKRVTKTPTPKRKTKATLAKGRKRIPKFGGSAPFIKLPPLNKRLIKAIEVGNHSRVADLIYAGADVRFVNKDGFTMKGLSVRHKNNKIKKTFEAWEKHASNQLLMKAQNMNQYPQALTPKDVRILAKQGADLNKASAAGYTPLMYAARAGNLPVVKALIENGANINLQSNIGLTALQEAARNNHTVLAKFLIDNGANPDLIDNRGRSAIAFAFASQNLVLAEYIINNGLNVNLQGTNGTTPLMLAVNFDNGNLVDLLLRKGADFTLANNDGFTALSIANNNNFDHYVRLFTPHIKTRK